MPLNDITEQEVRDLMDDWSRKGFFRARALGSRSAIESVTHRAAHTLRLRTHYEQRRVETVSVPYRAGPIDRDGEPPAVWDVPVRCSASSGSAGYDGDACSASLVQRQATFCLSGGSGSHW
jgi:hypothetical protein